MECSEIRALFDYDHWANRETVASLSTVPGGSPSADRPLKILGHVVGAQRIWLTRFEDPNPPNAQPWPAVTLDQCRAAVDELHNRWSALFDALTPEKLASDLAYRNTKGVEFRTPIQDVLMHLVMHSAYHRGQVAAAVREARGQPAATDYVVYLRRKAEGRKQ